MHASTYNRLFDQARRSGRRQVSSCSCQHIRMAKQGRQCLLGGTHSTLWMRNSMEGSRTQLVHLHIATTDFESKSSPESIEDQLGSTDGQHQASADVERASRVCQ